MSAPTAPSCIYSRQGFLFYDDDLNSAGETTDLYQNIYIYKQIQRPEEYLCFSAMLVLFLRPILCCMYTEINLKNGRVWYKKKSMNRESHTKVGPMMRDREELPVIREAASLLNVH